MPALRDDVAITAEAWQSQCEELVALASIYEQDFRLLSSGAVRDEDDPAGKSWVAASPPDADTAASAYPEDDWDALTLLEAGPPPRPAPFSCEVAVHVDVPASGLEVVFSTLDPDMPALVRSDGRADQQDQGSDLVATGHVIRHLPPVIMQLDMGPGYPASDPPGVQLHAVWLRPRHIDMLIEGLLQQWEESGPASIGYVWADWLRSESLGLLGMTSTGRVVLGPEPEDVGYTPTHAAQTTDLTRQISVASSSPEQIAASLVRYSAHRTEDLFQSESVTCPVCFEEVLGARCVRLPDCGHYSCQDCFRQYVNTQVSEGQVDSIRCIDTSCRAAVPVSILQSVLTQEQFDRWEKLLLEKTLDKMQDVCYCPRCQSVCVEDEDHCAQCPKCLYVFCGMCDDSWHPGSQCLDPHEAYKRRMERTTRSGNISQEERQARHAALMAEYKSMTMVLMTSKRCPACGMAIQKTEGCNKMRCGNCGVYFCFRCLKEVSDYDHFRQGGCELFDQEVIDRWNAQMLNQERMVQAQAMNHIAQDVRRGRLQGVRLAPCVTCGQMNVKAGQNNLIRCHACNSHFCYLCRTALRTRPGTHFGPSKCKQHSDD